MKESDGKASFRFGLGLCVAYGVLVWALLHNQSLPFPLGPEDQERVVAAVGRESSTVETGWVTALIDRISAQVAPSVPYPLMRETRLAAGVVCLVGLSVWAWRLNGWLFGCWVGLLAVGFYPLRLAATTLAPQSVCAAMLVWGGMLALGRPWSKTGTAEQGAGGFLLGAACLAAPWGFLYGLSLPLRAIFSRRFRRRLERPFWIGYIAGWVPGILWLGIAELSWSALLGIRLETLGWEKFGHFLHLAGFGLGWWFLLLAAVGVIQLSSPPRENRGWLFDFTWPILPSLVFGYADPLRCSLAFPGLVFLAALGVQRAGYVFVDKTERKWLSTFLALLVGYTSFFASLPTLRERQSHSAEVKDLAELILDRVPPSGAVALFRLNSVAEYLNALHPDKGWNVVGKERFPELPGEWDEAYWTEEIGLRSLWLDPKRMAEEGPGLGSGYLGEIQKFHPPQEILERGQVKLWKYAFETQTR